LSTALLVNPHDADELAEAMDRALTMPLAERQDRWQTAWRAIEGTTPALWGRNFLAALTRSSLTSPKGPSEPSSLTPPAREPITVDRPQQGNGVQSSQGALGLPVRLWPSRLS
jgi:hypothetical protein